MNSLTATAFMVQGQIKNSTEKEVDLRIFVQADLTFVLWLVNLPAQPTPLRNKGLIAGLIKGNQMVNNVIRPAISEGGTLGVAGWLAMIVLVPNFFVHNIPDYPQGQWTSWHPLWSKRLQVPLGQINPVEKQPNNHEQPERMNRIEIAFLFLLFSTLVFRKLWLYQHRPPNSMKK